MSKNYRFYLSLYITLLLHSIFVSFAFGDAVPQPDHNHFRYGARLIPHPTKVQKGGEDSFFVNTNVLAVADGVGGWIRWGIDPSKYSRTLCKNIRDFLAADPQRYENKPKELIRDASINNNFQGSSTLVVVYLDKENPILRASYIGDSIYIICRKEQNEWRVIFEAKEQQKNFNMPYQLGNMGGDGSDAALDVIHDVEHKDILVVASDGLFDNLTPDQVLKELLPFIDEEDEVKEPRAAAIQIADAAYRLSLDPTYHSPFTKRSIEAGRPFYGGKSDDITVVVGQVKLHSNMQQNQPSDEIKEPVKDIDL